jgi:hypothetical protein
MKKTRSEKSRDTVPLRHHSLVSGKKASQNGIERGPGYVRKYVKGAEIIGKPGY